MSGLLNRPDATLTLAVLAVSAVSLSMLLLHGLARRRAEKRIASYTRQAPAQARPAATAWPSVPVASPKPARIDLTAVEHESDRVERGTPAR